MRFVHVTFPNSALAQHERNSCTVYAVAVVLGVDYDKAHALLKAHGRKDRRGASIWLEKRALDTRGIVREVPIPAPPPKLRRCSDHYSFDKRDRYPTVAQFLRQLPRRGRFLLSAGHHSFAFVDGVLYDNNPRPKTRARIYSVMEFIPPAPQPHPSQNRPRFHFDLKTGTVSQKDINGVWKRLYTLEGKS